MKRYEFENSRKWSAVAATEYPRAKHSHYGSLEVVTVAGEAVASWNELTQRGHVMIDESRKAN